MLKLCSDTLNRHEATHGLHDLAQDRSHKPHRACTSCVSAKQRCHGGHPCARCERRNITCKYRGAQRQGSSSSGSQQRIDTPHENLFRDFAEPNNAVSTLALPNFPVTIPASIDTGPQAVATLAPELPSVTAPPQTQISSSGELLGMNWSDIPGLPDTVCTNEWFGMLPNHLPHDMLRLDDMTRASAFPFTWMMQPTQDSHSSYCLSQEMSNVSMPDGRSLISLDTTGSASSAEPRLDSHVSPAVRNSRPQDMSPAARNFPTDVCPSFPVLQEDGLQSANAELFGYVSKVPQGAYAALRDFYVLEHGFDDMSFPHPTLLHTFVELYFEHFDAHLPFIHPNRVERDDLSWILLTAIAATGSQYSEAKEASTFSEVLHNLLRRAIREVSLDKLRGIRKADKEECSR